MSLLLALGFSLILGSGPGSGTSSLPLLARHQPLHIFRECGLDAIAGGGLKQNPRVAQRNRLVAVVGYDEPDRHYAVRQVIDAKNRLFFLGVIRLSGDGYFFVGVYFNRSEGSGRLYWRGLMVAGRQRNRYSQDKNE